MDPSANQHNLNVALKAHRAGDFVRAKQIYQTVLAEEPHRVEVWYNLGMIFIAERQFSEAAHAFEQVLTQYPDHVSAHYYLANCYFSLEQFTHAQHFYEKTLALHPGHIDALNNLGALLLHENQTEQALQCFSTVVNINPQHIEARNNLATTLMQLQRYYHASEHFHILVAQQPQDVGIRYSYALSLLDSDNFEEAIQQFQQVLQLKPDHQHAESNLGIAYLKAGQLPQAEKIFAMVLTKHPDNQEIAYLYAALSGQSQPERAPDNYIKNLFNHYAKHYEQHMVDTLRYRVPQQLHDLLEKYEQPLPNRAWHIFDLGCGSGLSGLAFYHMAKYLAGVDLSAKMLTLAKNKLIYDDLFEDNLLNILNRYTDHFDLLIAADTFNYIGDFTTLFSICYQALKPRGKLLFSLESEPNQQHAWTLQNYARYTHLPDYVSTLAQQLRFDIIAAEKSTLRQQAQQPVSSWLYLLSK